MATITVTLTLVLTTTTFEPAKITDIDNFIESVIRPKLPSNATLTVGAYQMVK